MRGLLTNEPMAIVENNGRGLKVMMYAAKKDLAEAAIRQCWSEFFSPKEYMDWVSGLSQSITAQVSENIEVMDDIMAEAKVGEDDHEL